MYKGKTILCVIPARGGSKGLPGKNIKNLAGKPLIAYSIEQAGRSRYTDRVIVSTDSSEIAAVARSFGADVPFLRPADLARDESSTIDVLLHAIEWLSRKERRRFDILLLLHATTPLRSVDDIERCIELLVDTRADNVFSVTEAHRNPYFNMVEVTGAGTVALIKEGRFLTRQSAPSVYDMNSSIYAWWTEVLQREQGLFLQGTKIYEMPKERSIDIDDLLDFRIAEMLLTVPPAEPAERPRAAR